MGKYEKYLDEMYVNSADDLVADIHDFEEHGSVIVGRLQRVSRYHSEKFNKDQNEYIFDTDDGLKKVLLNENTDKCMNDPTLIGKILYIRYEGKIKLDSGKEFKKFTIKLIKEVLEGK